MHDDTSGDDPRLQRNLGLPGVFAICTGAMLSSGFFLLPGLAAAETGPSLPLAYLAAGVLVLPALLSLAELSSAMPRAGGPYYFLSRALGSWAATIGALGKYAQLLFKGAFAFVGVGAYLSLVVEVPIRPVAVGLVAVFTAVNLLGAKSTTRAEIGLVAVLLVLLTWFVIAGGIELAQEPTASLVERFDPLLEQGIDGFLAATALVFVSFAGVGQVASVSEEVRRPARTIPSGMLLALAVASGFYLLGTTIMVGLVEAGPLTGDPAPVATAVERFTALPLPTLLVVVAALAAFASTGNAAILSAARFPLAMARDHLLWRRFARLDRRDVPRTAVLATGGLLIAAILVFDIEGIAKLASAFLLLVFAGMCLAVIVFHASGAPDYEPGFVAPFYPWTQIIGVAVYVVLIVESGPQALALLALLVVGGSIWWATGVRSRVSPSGAICRLLGRVAERAGRAPREHASWLARRAAHPLDELIDRAIVFDDAEPEDGDGMDAAVRHAADAIADRVGGDRRELADDLAGKIGPWAEPADDGVTIAPLLLQGIEQPEMVVVRVGSHDGVAGDHAAGFIFVVDDEGSSARLLDLVAQLTATTHRTGFGPAWRHADGPKELRAALTEDVRTVTIALDAGRTDLVGARVADAGLPRGCLVALIRRRGATVVPDGEVRFEDGDEVTVLADADRIDEIEARFG